MKHTHISDLAAILFTWVPSTATRTLDRMTICTDRQKKGGCLVPYLILGIVFVLTLLNVLFQIRVRRRKLAATSEYQRLMAEIEERSQEIIAREALRIDRTYPIVSDSDVGYRFDVDSERGMGLFTDPSSVRTFRLADIVSSAVEIVPVPEVPKEYAAIRVVVTLAGDEQPLVIALGDRQRKRSSLIGKFIQDNARHLDAFIRSLVQPSV